jgi:proteasome lid subunit RPN8/RPN11
MTVYILENAFWNLLIASVEVYPHECLGLIIGTADADKYVIHNAVVFQTAARTRAGVVFPSSAVHKNVVEFLEGCLPHMRILGDFHSHTLMRAYYPSEDDRATMEESQIYLIIQIYRKKRNKPWKYNKCQTLLSGTTHDFYFRIGAWYGENGGKRFRLARIVCPFAAGFFQQ